MSRHTKPAAVLIGIDSMQGLQAARILARRHQLPVIGIAGDPRHAAARTRVCQEIIPAPTAGTGLIDTLMSLGARIGQRSVLYPCEDPSVLLVSRHRQQLERWYHILLPAPDVVEMLMDKVSFYDFARRNHLPVPATHVVHSRTEFERLLDQLKFPCVLKPRDSAALRWGKRTMLKAFKTYSPDELLAVHNRFKQSTECFIVQEWIEGSDADLYSCNCYFNAESQPLVTFIARKIRQWPPETGISSLGEECRNDQVLQTSLRLFQKVNFRGLGYLEMKRDRRTGEHFIVEPNIGRPTGRSAIAEAGGVELLYTMYCDALGWPLPSHRQQTYQGVKWIHVRKDLQSAFQYWRRGELTWAQWRKSLRGKKAFAMLDWRDPVPFVFDWLRALLVWTLPSWWRQRRQ